MPLNDAHKQLIKNQISDNFIHKLADICNDDRNHISINAVRARISAIDNVLASQEPDLAMCGLGEENECVDRFFDIAEALNKALEILKHPNPQCYTKEEIDAFIEKQDRNLATLLQKSSSPVNMESLPVNNVSKNTNDETYDLETLSGANLKNQPYGLLGFSVADDEHRQITADEVKAEVRKALEKVKTSLELKAKLIESLSSLTEAESDLRKIYLLVIESNNAQDPPTFVNDVIKSATEKINLQKNNGPFLNKLKTDIPVFSALIEKIKPKQEGNLGTETDDRAEESKEETLNLIQAINISLGGESEEWDALKAKLLENEESFSLFIIATNENPLFNPKDFLSFLEVDKKVKQRASDKTNLPLDYQEYKDIIAGFIGLNEEKFKQLEQHLEVAGKGKAELKLENDNQSLFLKKLAEIYSSAQTEPIHNPLIYKLHTPNNFKNDEFTDRDVRSYSEYVFSKKHPEASAFADYASVGIVCGAQTLADRMAKTIKDKKWGFYHYSTGGHWRLIVISPKQKVICLDSIGNGKLETGNLPPQITNDINNAFKKASSDKKTPEIEYYGLGTQRGVQCGLHSCLAMEEIISSITKNGNKTTPENLWQMIAMQRLADFQISNDSKINDRDLQIFTRIKDEGTFLKEDQKQLLNSVISNKSFDQERRDQFAKLQKEVNGIFLEKMAEFDQKSNFNVDDIINKVSTTDDKIKKKPTDEEIVFARTNAALTQLREQYLNALQSYQVNDTKKIYNKISADHCLKNKNDFIKGCQFYATEKEPIAENGRFIIKKTKPSTSPTQTEAKLSFLVSRKSGENQIQIARFLEDPSEINQDQKNLHRQSFN